MEKTTLSSRLKINDIVLIYLNDQDFKGYKIRKIKEIKQDKVLTSYYLNGDEKKSSKPHYNKDILGVVLPKAV